MELVRYMVCHLRDSVCQLHMCHVGDKLSSNAEYRTIIVVQKARVGQL